VFAARALRAEQLAEFNSRLAYLSFRGSKACSRDFNYKIARELGHLSVHASMSATFLLAGVSLETSLELVAHHEAHVARLTSSKTKAMSEPLYRLQGTVDQRASQRDAIEKWVKLRSHPVACQSEEKTASSLSSSLEFDNMLMPGCKATALTYTMNLKDFHKLFTGRLKDQGNETEVQEICMRMCLQLHDCFPLVIRSPDAYRDVERQASKSSAAAAKGEAGQGG
jgi:thymidylate synthase ThyX